MTRSAPPGVAGAVARCSDRAFGDRLRRAALRALPHARRQAARRTRGAEEGLGNADGLARLQCRQQQLHRLPVHRHGLRLLRRRRHPVPGDARAAGRAAGRHRAAGDLQPAVHDARLGDDVPVRRAGRRGHRRAAAAADDRGARPAVPAAVGVLVLGLSDRRGRLLLLDLLQPGAVGWLVHVPAAELRASIPRASTPTSGCWASASSRSAPSPAPSNSSSACCARAPRA